VPVWNRSATRPSVGRRCSPPLPDPASAARPRRGELQPGRGFAR
jgi:hypothetical protein